MTTPIYNNLSSPHTTLRQAANTELDAGNPDINSGWTLPAETLGLLYKLASDPDSAPDALKLLHELQTHQVELELQYRQLLSNEQFMKQQLSKFKALLNASDIGYIMADADAQIMEINTAATHLLNIENQAVRGMPVSHFFQPDAQNRLRHLFKHLAQHEDDAEVVSIVSPQVVDAEGKRLKITASISIAANAVLMTIMEYLPSQPN